MEEHILKEKEYYINAKNIIDPNIHKFLYVLVKYIFFGKNYMSKTRDKLVKIIKKLNIRSLDEKILYKNRSNITDLEAILEFIKTQNFALASEILENIIIRVLSFAFKAKSDDFFGKYLYNDLKELKTNKNIFKDWIDTDLLEPLFNKTNKDLEYALENDKSFKKLEEPELAKKCRDSAFLQILYCIYKSKIYIDNKYDNSYSDNKTNSNATTTINGDFTSFYSQLSNLFFGKNLGEKMRDKTLPVSFSILISTYIYHQNRISPFMKYTMKDEKDKTKVDLENLPFSYVLSEAGINDLYSATILSPIRLEPRVTEIELDKNRIDIYGMFELHKVLIFNKNIKTISIKNCGTKSKSLSTFNDNYTLFNNNNVEKLNISSNYLKSDADTNLSKLISYLKELKILILSNNILKSGLGYFFVTLKNLYRKKKTKLEELYLINCELDDISFYELGELLKSKYCKLKCLCLNENIIPSDINFFKALKKNRSLEEIYFYGCGINSEKTDEIDRLINNTNLQSLYLYTNKIHDFNQYLRIIYKTTLIKNEKEKNNKSFFIDNPTLFNLNVNSADCYNQNNEKLDILLEGMKNTNLSVLDLSSVLKNVRNEKHNMNFKYNKAVNKIKEYLSNKQLYYKYALKETEENKLNIIKYNKFLEDKDKKELGKFDSYIENIANDERFKNKIYILEKAKELISDLQIKNEEEKKEKLKKLVDYINFKKNKILLDKNEKILESKKMILI